MGVRILIVEDEPGLLLTLEDRLRAEGYEVISCSDGLKAEQIARDRLLDLMILDVMLPGQSGFELCSALRRAGIKTPILMLTALHEVDDRVEGLKRGADDYLDKPFAFAELLARIEALLRRLPPRDEILEVGAAQVDFGKTEVTREGQPVSLSALSFRLLAYLIEHAGKTVSREQLLLEVWGHKATPNTRTVDVHMGWLRRALEPDPGQPKFLITVHGMGYRLELNGTGPA